MPHQSIYTRSIALLILLLPALLFGVGLPAIVHPQSLSDAQQAAADDEVFASLFSDQRNVGTLAFGAMVRLLEPEADDEWCEIQHRGRLFDTRRTAFKTLRSLAQETELEIVKLEIRLKGIESTTQDRLAYIQRLWRKILVVQVDHTRRFAVPVTTRRRIRVEQPVVELGDGRLETREQQTVQMFYLDKITTNKMRRLTEQLNEDLAELDTQVTELQEEREIVLNQLQSYALNLRHLERKFARFDQDDPHYNRDLYIVTAIDKVALYRKRKIARRLSPNSLVIARPNPKFKIWLDVFFDNEVLSGKSEHFSSFPDWGKQYKGDRIAKEARAGDLQQALEQLRYRLGVYAELSLELDVELSISGRYHTIHGSDEACTVCGLVGAGCCHNVIEVLDRAHARRVLGDWQEQQAKIQAQARAVEKQVDALRIELVEMKHAYEDILAKQDAFLTAPEAPHD
jgi:hypothetical protein